MKQILQNMKTGETQLVNIPVPNIRFTDGYGGGTTEVLDEVDFTIVVSAEDVGDSNFGKFLDDKGQEVGSVRFSNPFFSYPLSKEVIQISLV